MYPWVETGEPLLPAVCKEQPWFSGFIDAATKVAAAPAASRARRFMETDMENS